MTKKEIILMLFNISEIMQNNKDYLIDLDGVIGDSDLGITMSKGFKAAYEAVSIDVEDDLGKLLYNAGKAMSNAAPSTMGTLMATGLMSAGRALKGKTQLGNDGIYQIYQAYLDGVIKRGKAKVGEKTVVDGLNPAVISLRESAIKKEDISVATKKAMKAAKKGFESTASMVAVHGRAAIHGEKSRNVKDPGAAVAMLIMQAVAKTFTTSPDLLG